LRKTRRSLKTSEKVFDYNRGDNRGQQRRSSRTRGRIYSRMTGEIFEDHRREL
jgi:hypothetical protein